MTRILILNGPNLNLLGTRQPEVYGRTTLKDIESVCIKQGESVGASVTCFQSNHEGDLIDQIHAAKGRFDGIIMNAGALSHTSIGIMDALLSVEVPTIDLHLSNIHRREDFRHMSYVAKAAVGSIVGFGPGGYLLAIDAIMMHLDSNGDAQPAPAPTPAQKMEPLATSSDQMLEEPAPYAPKPQPPKPQASDIAAAAAAAIAAQSRRGETGKKTESLTDTASQTKPTSNAAFNEMFETPPREVLESLGIAAPELHPLQSGDGDNKMQVRKFRKLT